MLYNFFNIRAPIEGIPTGIFLPDRRTSTIRVFMGPPLFSLVEDRGPVDFPMSVPLQFVILTQHFENKILYNYRMEKWSRKHVFVKYFIIPT